MSIKKSLGNLVKTASTIASIGGALGGAATGNNQTNYNKAATWSQVSATRSQNQNQRNINSSSRSSNQPSTSGSGSGSKGKGKGRK